VTELAPPQPARRFTRDVVWSGASLVAFGVAGLAWASITAYGLGAGDRGNLSIIGVAVMLGALGCAAGTNYTLPSLLAERRFERGELLGGALALGALANVLVFGAALTVAIVLFVERLFPAFVLAMALLLPASWVKTLLAAMLAAGRDFKGIFWSALAGLAVQVGTGAVLLATGAMTLRAAVLANAAGALVTVAAAAVPVRRALSGSPPAPPPTAARRIARAATAALPGALAQALNYRLDLLVVATLAGAATTGIYAVGIILTEALFYPALIVSQVLLPRAAQMLGRSAAEPAYRLVLGTTVALGAVVWLAAPYLVRVLFGPAFVEASSAVRILVPGVVVLSLWQLATFELAGRGRVTIMSASALTGVAVTIAADLVLVPRYDVQGAAAAAALGYVATTLVVLPALRREFGYRIRTLLVPRRSDVALFARELRAMRAEGRT
jgi:O-antigen/teichoic acid export membrane protein